MPFFRPERALARLLRHDHLSHCHPHYHSHSPRSLLARLFDHHHTPSAHLYTINEEPRNHHQHLHHQDPRLNQQTEKRDQPSDNQVSRAEREDGMERRGRRHRGRRHALSPFFNDPFFSSPFPSLFNSFSPLTPFAPSSFAPMPDMALDMFSTPTSYSIHAAVPGLNKQDIKLTVDDGVLTIEAERKETRAPATSSSTSPTSTQAPIETKAQVGRGAGSTTTAAPDQSTQASDAAPSSASTASSPATSPIDSTFADSVEEEDGLSVHHVEHVESFYGRVERSVQLPDDAKVDELTAKYEDGVIKIEIPRVQEQKKQAKRIEIQ